jgi:hypothetical protein
MLNWNRSTWVICAAVAVGAYFSTALWLKNSYFEPPKPAGATLRLNRPFFKMRGSDTSFGVKASSLDELSDSPEAPRRSPFLLYENQRSLGPAHSDHVDIANLAHGRFSHWNDSGFIFSSSDGTNPNSNGRTYWVVIPSSAAK